MLDIIKRLGGHVLIYGFGNVGNRVVGFLLIPIYSRYLAPEDYGVLALVAMLGQVLYAFLNMGQSRPLPTYFRHDDPKERDTVLTTSLWLILGLSFPWVSSRSSCRPLASLLTGSPAYTWWIVLGTAASSSRSSSGCRWRFSAPASNPGGTRASAWRRRWRAWRWRSCSSWVFAKAAAACS
jgi:O-antigen/teichoic acid export membrane protein